MRHANRHGVPPATCSNLLARRLARLESSHVPPPCGKMVSSSIQMVCRVCTNSARTRDTLASDAEKAYSTRWNRFRKHSKCIFCLSQFLLEELLLLLGLKDLGGFGCDATASAIRLFTGRDCGQMLGACQRGSQRRVWSKTGDRRFDTNDFGGSDCTHVGRRLPLGRATSLTGARTQFADYKQSNSALGDWRAKRLRQWVLRSTNDLQQPGTPTQLCAFIARHLNKDERNKRQNSSCMTQP